MSSHCVGSCESIFGLLVGWVGYSFIYKMGPYIHFYGSRAHGGGRKLAYCFLVAEQLYTWSCPCVRVLFQLLGLDLSSKLLCSRFKPFCICSKTSHIWFQCYPAQISANTRSRVFHIMYLYAFVGLWGP